MIVTSRGEKSSDLGIAAAYQKYEILNGFKRADGRHATMREQDSDAQEAAP